MRVAPGQVSWLMGMAARVGDSRSLAPPAPSQNRSSVAECGRYYPITVAGPRPVLTAFPLPREGAPGRSMSRSYTRVPARGQSGAPSDSCAAALASSRSRESTLDLKGSRKYWRCRDHQACTAGMRRNRSRIAWYPQRIRRCCPGLRRSSRCPSLRRAVECVVGQRARIEDLQRYHPPAGTTAVTEFVRHEDLGVGLG